ncbi:MAG: insulinase family protein [Alphaproteobacteria bacterium]|nr:insulinase family protein [Alphaproteobacteria bacterium]
MRRLPRIALALALVWVGLGPAHAGLFSPETTTLANGLRIVVIPDHRAPVVTHMVWYLAGAADDPPGRSGIAHFLEHLMFKGTPSTPPGEFSRLVARHGGRENAFTSLDYTAYYQTVAVAQLEMVMRLEADRMANLRITAEQVNTEREVILEERRARSDNDPRALFAEQVGAALYLAHPYGRPVIGWEHEIRVLSEDDALAFYRSRYAPNNAILIVAGDVTLAQVLPLAERHYGAVPARAIATRERPSEPPQRAARRVEMIDGQVGRPSWGRSYLVPGRAEAGAASVLAVTVLADILGGGTTSRLYRALVVEERLAAHAGSYYLYPRLDYGEFNVYATPTADDGVAAIEAAVDRVIAALVRDGVTEVELERAKTGLIAAGTYARDDIEGAARLFGSALAAGVSIAEIEAWQERVREVTADAVIAAARTVLVPAHSVTGVLSPVAAAEP